MHTSYSMMIIYNLYNLGGNYENKHHIWKVGSNESKAAGKNQRIFANCSAGYGNRFALVRYDYAHAAGYTPAVLTGAGLLILGMGFLHWVRIWR